MIRSITRRRVLRGMVAGTAVSVGLPLLDVFLNGNGDALAQGAALPTRFGTWFWGCGINPDRWVPEEEGPDYPLSVELAALGDLKEHVSVLSGFNVPLDGRLNWPHSTGVLGFLTGIVPEQDGRAEGRTFDIAIAQEIGADTRFRSLEMSATGEPSQSYSRDGAAVTNPSAVSPLDLYARIFGDGFADPNAGDFMPDPRMVVQQSALSAVREDARRLEPRLGSHDRHRLDQYFTSLRQLERQIEVALSGPPDLAACRKPDTPGGEEIGSDLPQAQATHRIMTELLVHALLCDQTRVFNMLFSWGLSALRLPGADTAHHQLTHDEGVDEELGYQPRATEFALASMDEWAGFVRRLAEEPEGDGTLLDHCLVVAHSESSFAKSHDVTGLPVMLAGRAGGRARPGVHVRGGGEPVSRVALTVQQLMGLSVGEFGTRSMVTTSPIGDVFA